MSRLIDFDVSALALLPSEFSATWPAPLLEPANGDALTWQRISSPTDPAFGEVLAFANRQQGYWVDAHPRPTSVREVTRVLSALPAGATSEQKGLWALRRGGRVVGCLDVMRHWPQQGTVAIGLLLVDESLRRQGLGGAVLAQLAQRCHAWPGVRRWRAAVQEHHAGALAFWRGAGFLEIGVRQVAPNLRGSLIVLERAIPR